MLRINGKDYKEAEIDFNAVCELEDMGIKIFNLKGVSGAKIARAYAALCMGGADMLDLAGVEINNHIINGGKLEAITEAFGKAVNESGFFQALKATTEQGDTASEKKKTPQTK